jgi:hypothetical protein
VLMQKKWPASTAPSFGRVEASSYGLFSAFDQKLGESELVEAGWLGFKHELRALPKVANGPLWLLCGFHSEFVYCQCRFPISCIRDNVL